MPPPTSVPEQYRPGYMPPNTGDEIQSTKPGLQGPMNTQPLDDIMADGSRYKPAGKLQGKRTVVTGGDSGIGRAVAILYALEGASVFLHYYPTEQADAESTKAYIAKVAPGAEVCLHGKDFRTEAACLETIAEVKQWSEGQLDVLVLNHATQNEVPHVVDLESEQWRHVFDVNIHSFFYLTKGLIPIMPWGSSIVNCSSMNPFLGHPQLLDYTATKGAIVAFTRALSNQIVQEKGIRVNAVCPGPIWTPLVVSGMQKDSLEAIGPATKMNRPGQPVECATAFVFLGSVDSSYFTGQCLHVNGGTPY